METVENASFDATDDLMCITEFDDLYFMLPRSSVVLCSGGGCIRILGIRIAGGKKRWRKPVGELRFQLRTLSAM